MERKDEQASCGCEAKAGMGGQNGNAVLKFHRAYFTKESMAYWAKSNLLPRKAYASLIQQCKGGWVLSYVM